MSTCSKAATNKSQDFKWKYIFGGSQWNQGKYTKLSKPKVRDKTDWLWSTKALWGKNRGHLNFPNVKWSFLDVYAAPQPPVFIIKFAEISVLGSFKWVSKLELSAINNDD